MSELWKTITGQENYEVSNLGNFRNLIRGEKLLISYIKKNGYAQISLGTKTFRAHIVVAKAFIPNPQNLPLVNHKDGVKHHNWVENLEWMSHSGNSQHAYDNGLRVSPRAWKGKNGASHNRSKLVHMMDKEGNILRTFGSVLEAERETKVNHQNISNCCRNVRKSAGGFAWSY